MLTRVLARALAAQVSTPCGPGCIHTTVLKFGPQVGNVSPSDGLGWLPVDCPGLSQGPPSNLAVCYKSARSVDSTFQWTIGSANRKLSNNAYLLHVFKRMAYILRYVIRPCGGCQPRRIPWRCGFSTCFDSEQLESDKPDVMQKYKSGISRHSSAKASFQQFSLPPVLTPAPEVRRPRLFTWAPSITRAPNTYRSGSVWLSGTKYGAEVSLPTRRGYV